MWRLSNLLPSPRCFLRSLSGPRWEEVKRFAVRYRRDAGGGGWLLGCTLDFNLEGLTAIDPLKSP